MKIIKSLFCDLRVALVLMAVYAIGCGIATFIEKYDGTMAARYYVYGAFWFDVLHIWLVVALIGCFITSQAWQRKKYASLLLHFSFIVIILGAGITRYFGFEGMMNLREGESTNLITTNEHYIFIQVKDLQNNVQYAQIQTHIDEKLNSKIERTIKFFDKPLHISTGEVHIPQNGIYVLDAKIDFAGQSTDTQILRQGNLTPTKESITLLTSDEYMIFLAWGVDQVPLPFKLKLEKFELERYPGSNSPASYASQVEVLDGANPPMPYRIFMNNVLDYGGYRFFQSSYDTDEKGSHISVNRDPGKTPTYIGYTLLVLGVIWLLFDKNGRFRTLSRFLKTQKNFCIALAFSAALLPYTLHAQTDSTNLQTYSNTQEMTQEALDEADSILQQEATQERDSINPHARMEKMDNTSSLLNVATEEQLKLAIQSFGAISKEFDKVLMQDFGGRTKPIHTLANEYIHQITKKTKFLGMDSTQIFLTMTFLPDAMQGVKMIATETPQLRQILGLDEKQKYISFADVLADGQYLLQNYVEEANLKSPASRNAFEKDVINVDKRVNYAYLIYTGEALRIFPDSKAENNQWFSPLDAISSAVAQEDMAKATKLLEIYKQLGIGIQNGLEAGKWDEAIKAIGAMREYQQANAQDTLISQAKVDSEIFLNTYNPFYQLTLPYILISVVFFIIVLSAIVRNKPLHKLLHNAFYLILLLLFIIHTCALALRWYVGGHAPWSNAYESMIYIAWAAMLSGVVFFRKSNLALCASSFLAGVTLFVAYLGDMDPQIGNLMPVLKSYWLNIHVSVITASYGFLGLCFVLGLITLLMFIISHSKITLKTQSRENITSSIFSLTALNEMSMILGLFLLSVGNFLGGVWANESWGRYWGWDSKETWALISIGVYAIILHLRLICKTNLPFVFASASVLGFFSVLMTYFGVNYYLTGMHSYAAGESEPLPLWFKLIIVSIFVLVIIASRNRQLNMPKLS
ncbi:cytochrome c biogenesis protein CcsA [Helicobacter typhlonius]|uniref:cytochrome c biogenesis protein CcsA n=1 Tax=Helicobacter typhlonius TaxID=76936 RepID=UPI002FE41FA3